MTEFENRFLTTETLYVDDLSYTSVSFIAHRTSYELSKHGLEIDHEYFETAIDDAISEYKEHLHPEELSQMKFYRWELLWLCSPYIVKAIGKVIEGREVDEFWYFDELDEVASLFARSALHTIELMKSDFTELTGDRDPLGTLLQSFLNGDEEGQAAAKMLKKGPGLTLVH